MSILLLAVDCGDFQARIRHAEKCSQCVIGTYKGFLNEPEKACRGDCKWDWKNGKCVLAGKAEIRM